MQNIFLSSFILNAEKISGPKRSIKITDHFTCNNLITTLLAHFANSFTLAKQGDH